MTFQSEAITYFFTWLSVLDGHTCIKCISLNGETIEGDLYADVLRHSYHGAVWDLNADHSLAHGGTPYHCRCQLQTHAIIHLDKMRELGELAKIMEWQELESTQVDFPLGMSIQEVREHIGALRDDIGAANVGAKELVTNMRSMLILGQRMGMPSQISDALSVMSAGRFMERGISRISTGLEAGGVSGVVGAAGGAALLGLAVYSGWNILRQDVEQDIQNILKRNYQKQQALLEAEKMKLRGRHY